MLEKMEIAIISPVVPPLLSMQGMVGGAENYALSLSAKIAENGNSVTLYTRSKGKSEEFRLGNNLKIKYLKSSSGWDVNSFSSELVKELMVTHFDVIHVHQLFTVLSLSSLIAGRLKRIPLVLTDHGGGWELLVSMPRLCARLPNVFAAVSYYSLNRLLRYAPGKKSFVLYGGVDVNLFRPTVNGEELKEKFHLNGFQVVLFVGRITRIKGVDILIRALPYLPSNTKLLIVGQILDWEYFNYIKSLVKNRYKERIIFTGFIEEQKLPQFYNACDVYVQPSVYVDYGGQYHGSSELLGLAKLEAMACGKAVVVSDVGGLPEKVIDRWNGKIVRPSDERELAKAINNLLADEELRKRMGQNGLAMVQNECTWNAVARRAIKCYHSVWGK